MATRSGDGYKARVKVPPRGLRKVIVGLQGWQTADGRTTRRDRFFQFDPPLARDCGYGEVPKGPPRQRSENRVGLATREHVLQGRELLRELAL